MALVPLIIYPCGPNPWARLTGNGLDLGELQELPGSLDVEVGDTDVLDQSLLDELQRSVCEPYRLALNSHTFSISAQVGETSSESSTSRSFLPDLPLMVCSWVGRTPAGASTFKLI